MREERKLYKVLVGKLVEIRPVKGQRRTGEDGTRMDIYVREIG
jgi:hypothetical protein